ncbi:MAG: imidazole glycerol phosphate synthase subunit HisH [Clostridia bacterium]|nr:imidazole glycerol phosphate synthase subunit HisH [Clostridia bacterium]
MKTIGIIDYGMGNLHSVLNACKFLGINAFCSGDADKLSEADGLILPGVGAFPDAMTCLESTGLDLFIKEYVKEKPLLGICLGMQLLFDSSSEVRECKGLGLIPGKVIKLTACEKSREYKIPHMGWNSLEILNPDSPIMKGQSDVPFVYFVHSFKALPDSRDDIIAVSDYGEEVCAAVGRGNVFGTQFHPEKSEKTGLRMISAFAEII